jgi:hypothetical protein
MKAVLRWRKEIRNGVALFIGTGYEYIQAAKIPARRPHPMSLIWRFDCTADSIAVSAILDVYALSEGTPSSSIRNCSLCQVPLHPYHRLALRGRRWTNDTP